MLLRLQPGSGLRNRASRGTRQKLHCLLSPSLGSPVVSLPLHFVGYKQVTNLSRFKGRGQKPDPSMGGVSRSHCGPGNYRWGHLFGKAIHHSVFTRYCLRPDHHPPAASPPLVLTSVQVSAEALLCQGAWLDCPAQAQSGLRLRYLLSTQNFSCAPVCLSVSPPECKLATVPPPMA